MSHVGHRPEIDERTIKLIIGVVALGLAPLTSALSPAPLDSISAAYHEGGAAQSVFVGFLFAVAAMLLAYNGRSRREMWLSKIAAVAALGVALFPCICGTHAVRVPAAHAVAATIMFLVLAWFCLIFYRRAHAKARRSAQVRAGVYAVCGGVIVAAIALLGVNQLTSGALQQVLPRLVFYCEAAALTAFGVSWLNASHVLPWINHPSERFAPWRDVNPA